MWFPTMFFKIQIVNLESTIKNVKAMNWNNIARRISEDYQIQLVRGICANSRKIAIETIADEFPNIPRIRIAATVDRCLSRNEQPISTPVFLSYVQSVLK